MASAPKEPPLYYASRVQIMIEIDQGQSWSPQETGENVMRQARREAESYLVDLVHREGGKIRIVGTPEVIHIVGKARA